MTELLDGGACESSALAADTKPLTSGTDLDGPPAWRFIHSGTPYLGPFYFAVEDASIVATSENTIVTVTGDGFTVTVDDEQEAVTSIEVIGGHAVVIRADGSEVELPAAPAQTLLRFLLDGEIVVTSVPAAFGFAVQQPTVEMHSWLAKHPGRITVA